MVRDALIDKLHTNREAIRALVTAVSNEQACWKPSTREWSILEVINHLYDEEREDFRKRLDITLHQPGVSWPPIDPEGWVHERTYQERDLGHSLQSLLAEREQSVQWLQDLSAPDWKKTHDHPSIGTISAGDILTSWIVHDFLHMRQLVRLHYHYTNKLAEPFSSHYAGRW